MLGTLTKRSQPDVRVADITATRVVPVAPFTRVSGRSRAFVKIQDGCQHRCAFCIVPAARGPSRSQDPKVVLDQVRALARGRRLSRHHAHRRGHRPLRLGSLPAHHARRAPPDARGGGGAAVAAPLLGAAVLLHAGAGRGRHHAAGDGSASPPAAAERRSRAAADAATVPHRRTATWSIGGRRHPGLGLGPTSSSASGRPRTSGDLQWTRCRFPPRLLYSDRKGTEAARWPITCRRPSSGAGRRLRRQARERRGVPPRADRRRRRLVLEVRDRGPGSSPGSPPATWCALHERTPRPPRRPLRSRVRAIGPRRLEEAGG
jgi:hypothetical protein